MEIPAQKHAGMTEELHAGITEEVHAGMTEEVHAGMTEEVYAGMTEEVHAGMTICITPVPVLLPSRPNFSVIPALEPGSSEKADSAKK